MENIVTLLLTLPYRFHMVGVYGLLLLLIGGCQSSALLIDGVGPNAEAAEATPAPIQTSTLLPRPTDGSPTPAVTEEPEDQSHTLIFWTVEPVSSEAEGEPGNQIDNSLRLFRRNNPDIMVEVLIKKPSGKGGVLDFLRTARDVAPTILPDVAVMNAADLSQAYADGLIQPLDGRLDRSIVQDLLPVARRVGTIEEQLLGVPLGLELEHTVYNEAIFETPPLLWRDIFTANTTYLFPAQGVNGLVNDSTLAQYYSVGGKLLDAEGTPTFDEASLRSVLEIYQQAVENKTINPVILEASTANDLWPRFVDREAGIAQITVRRYLADRDLVGNTNFTSLPVQDIQNTPVLITHGWVLVLIADAENLQQQSAALQLMEWFMSTSNNAVWNEANGSIPTRDSSYQQVAQGDPYWEFLAGQLNVAQPEPGFAGYDRLGRIFQQAVAQVISGQATAEEATATAIDALTQ